jgi:hypothetical protein
MQREKWENTDWLQMELHKAENVKRWNEIYRQ